MRKEPNVLPSKKYPHCAGPIRVLQVSYLPEHTLLECVRLEEPSADRDRFTLFLIQHGAAFKCSCSFVTGRLATVSAALMDGHEGGGGEEWGRTGGLEWAE